MWCLLISLLYISNNLSFGFLCLSFLVCTVQMSINSVQPTILWINSINSLLTAFSSHTDLLLVGWFCDFGLQVYFELGMGGGGCSEHGRPAGVDVTTQRQTATSRHAKRWENDLPSPSVGVSLSPCMLDSDTFLCTDGSAASTKQSYLLCSEWLRHF